MTKIIEFLYSFPFYPICLGYWAWRSMKRWSKSSLDGVIGASPGTDMIAAVFLAPILAPIDMGISVVQYLIRKIKSA